MPDYCPWRTDPLFLRNNLHIRSHQQERDVGLLVLVQRQPLAWRMEFLNDSEWTDLLGAKSMAEGTHFKVAAQKLTPHVDTPNSSGWFQP
jgi:hypothetical protein